MRHAFIALWALLLWPGLPVPAEAGAGTRTVRDHIESARALFSTAAGTDSSGKAKSVQKRVLAIASAFLDSGELGRNVFKDQWAEMTESQQEKALELMGRLVEANYAIALYKEREFRIKYVSEKTVGSGRVVSTKLKTSRRGRAYTFTREFRLRVTASSWRCFDYSNDGVGLIVNYRAQINRIIKKRGIDGLFGRMEKIAQKTEARLTRLLKGAAE